MRICPRAYTHAHAHARGGGGTGPQHKRTRALRLQTYPYAHTRVTSPDNCPLDVSYAWRISRNNARLMMGSQQDVGKSAEIPTSISVNPGVAAESAGNRVSQLHSRCLFPFGRWTLTGRHPRTGLKPNDPRGFSGTYQVFRQTMGVISKRNVLLFS